MGDVWLPGADVWKCPERLLGRFVLGYAPRMGVHTFEPQPQNVGRWTPDGLPEATRKYAGHDAWPHFTLHCKGDPFKDKWSFTQHIPVDRPARAFKNLPGGDEVNNANAVQVEVLWRAENARNMPVSALRRIAELGVWLHFVRGMELYILPQSSWLSYPASYGSSPVRFIGGPKWRNFSGIFGHEHAPENDHGDPGNINAVFIQNEMNRIMEEMQMPTADEIADAILRKLNAQFDDETPDIRQPDFGSMVGQTYNKVGDVQGRLSRLETKLDLVISATRPAVAAPSAEVSARWVSEDDPDYVPVDPAVPVLGHLDGDKDRDDRDNA